MAQQNASQPVTELSIDTEINTGSSLDQPLDRLEAFHNHRGLLFSIAYRMLGSAADAEDILQETYIRWQQSHDFEIRSPKAFLVTIATRLCINHLQSARVKREEYFGSWLPEPVLTDFMDKSLFASPADESLSVAFLMLLERLTPPERAIFILHEVFDYEYPQIAQILELSEANCRQVLHRARQHLKAGRPRFEAPRKKQEELIENFLQASAQGDMQGLLAMFSKDIVLYADGGGKATAVPNPIYGSDNVARFVLGGRKKFVPAEVVSRIAQVNGRPGIVTYLHGSPFAVISMEISEGVIRNIYIVRNPDKLARLPIM